MGKQSTVQRSALLKLPCNALFMSLILPDGRQIYSFYYLAVIESVSLRERKISITKSQNQFAEMLLKPLLVVFGLQNDENATRGALWGHSAQAPAPGSPQHPSRLLMLAQGASLLPGMESCFLLGGSPIGTLVSLTILCPFSGGPLLPWSLCGVSLHPQAETGPFPYQISLGFWWAPSTGSSESL